MALVYKNGEWIDDGTDTAGSPATTIKPATVIPPVQAPTNGVTNAATSQPQSQPDPQQDVFSTTPKNLSEGYYSTLSDIYSGKAFDSTKQATNLAASRAAQNLRATTAANNAGRIGQGSAVASQNAVEQNLASAATDTALNLGVAQESAKQSALTQTLETAKASNDANLANRSQNLTEAAALGYTDATGKKIAGSIELANKAQTTEEAKLTETARQFNITNATDIAHFGETMKLNYAQLSQADKQFLLSYGLDEAKFNESKSQFATTIDLEKQKILSNETLTKLGITSGETIAGMRISADKDLATMQINAAASLAKDENFLKQQGIDIQKASVQGYTDSDGNHVMGSAEIAAKTFGLQSTQVADSQKELFGWTDSQGVYHKGKMDLLSAEDKRNAEALYGYNDQNGNHIPGSLELQAESVNIQKQGMTLEEAKAKGYIDSNGTYHEGSLAIAAKTAQAEVDQLYGFVDPNTGEYVAGSASLAQKQFGLQSDSLELQKQELKGYTDENGNHVPGKYELLSNEDKRAADALYGKDIIGYKGQVIHLAGSMEIAADQNEIAKQGLTLTEAGLKGYDKTNADGTVTHVAGSAENAAAQIGLEAQSYADQKKELFGYYNEEAATWVKGKIDLMNDEQKDAAYQLYGDPSTGLKGSLELQNEQIATSLELARKEFDATYAVGGIEDRKLKMQEASADSAQYWDTSKKVATYAQTHLDVKDPLKDPTAVATLAEWWKAKYGNEADTSSTAFQTFATNEWKAATDNRLTNPIDQSIYSINSSTELDDTTKKQMVAILKDTSAGGENKFITLKDGTMKLVSKDTVVLKNGTVFEPEYVFDTSNITGTFAAGAGIVRTDGTVSYLSNGQKISLKTPLTAPTSQMVNGVKVKEVIPPGNYTVSKATASNGDEVSWLTDVDTGKMWQLGMGTPPDGYTVNKETGELTKTSSSSLKAPASSGKVVL